MEVQIEKIVHGGFGIARLDGRSCLVPFAVPGDVLDVECAFERGVSFGWIRRIVRPSVHRRVSRCPVFTLCGGCDFDHIDYGFELEVKRGILAEDLERLARLAVVPTEGNVSGPPYGYRNHAQFKVDAAGNPGFFAKRSHDVVPVPRQGCLLLHERITGYVKGLLADKAFRRGGFRVRVNHEGSVFKKGIPGEADDPFFTYRVRGIDMRMNIDDFFQVNGFLLEQWVGRIEEYLDPDPRDRVVDLYSGSGIIGLSVAPRVESVIGIEMNRNAVRSALFNAKLNGIGNVSFVRADALKGLEAASAADKIVVDPPRSGLSPELIERMASLDPKLLVYVSCDTATFARDCACLGRSGYALRRVCLIDMFPRTRHMELVSMFAR